MSLFQSGMDRRQWMAAVTGLAFASTLGAQPAKTARLVVIGGAEDRLKDRVILRKFVEYCGGSRARIRLITTASAQPAMTWESYRAVFSELGVDNFEQLALTDRDSAFAPQLSQEILQADGIFISGGDQGRLMDVIWETPAYRSLHEAFHLHACCLGGTSAGAAVMSRHMISQGPAVLRPIKWATETDIGLGFVSNAVVDQHFSERRRLARLMSTLAQRPDLLGVGIDEDTALVIERNRSIEVIGRGAVTVVDPSRMQSNVDDVGLEEQMEMLGVVIHMLPSGHRYSLDSKLQAARWPESLRRVLTRLVAPGPLRG
ncbi:cyanophycinase [Limnohabitans sp. DM1]|uniref:cyanophycinase n=1 Tax=Limnohabitans sp. DM1 TaxID=1597955 RepID=UPI000B801AAB|nr:cyanophycinase [Limnohabitans sp. DM1]